MTDVYSSMFSNAVAAIVFAIIGVLLFILGLREEPAQRGSCTECREVVAAHDLSLDKLLRVARSRKVEQVADDVGGTVRLPLHLLQQCVFRIGLGDHAEQHLRVARNAR